MKTGKVKIQGVEGRKGIKDRRLENKNKMKRMKETGKRGISRGRKRGSLRLHGGAYQCMARLVRGLIDWRAIGPHHMASDDGLRGEVVPHSSWAPE